MNLQKTLLATALLLAGLMLVGCINVQTNVGIYGNEQWSGVTALQLSAEFAQMMAEAEQNGGETSMQMDSQEIDQWLAQAQQAAGRSDISVEFQEIKNEDGSLSYILSGSGQGLEALNQIFFNGEADISSATVNGQRQITIKSTLSDSGEQPQELTPEELAMQQQMMQAMGIGVSFRLTGGEIISSNATRIEGNTAIWENPAQIEVTLTEAAAFDPASIAVVTPPAGGSGAPGLSPEAMTTLMESIAAEMAQEMEQSGEMMAAEAAPQEEASTGGPTTAETETDSAPAQPENMPPTDTGASTEPGSAAPAEAAAAPTQADANLPSSGGILPASGGGLQLTLAALLLLALTGGALTGLRQ